jgi:hypothetical protein
VRAASPLNPGHAPVGPWEFAMPTMPEREWRKAFSDMCDISATGAEIFAWMITLYGMAFVASVTW